MSTKFSSINQSVKSLTPYARNSRTHSDAQIAQISASIKEFGFTNPVIVDEAGGIIAGHGRVLAAIRLGMAEVPTVVVTGWSEAQKKAYVIADNKLALNAGWDEAMLAVEFQELEALGYDLAFTGFSLDEIGKLNPAAVEGLTDEDAVPETPAEPITKLGDVWVLGDHRLVCGDSTSATDVETLMAGQKPNTMITDPPYGVAYEAGWRAEAKDRKKTAREENSSLQNDDRADWYDAWVLFPGNVAYVWHASAFTDVVKQSLERAGFDVKQQIIWNKNVHALSRSDYHWKHEPCWYAVKKDRPWHGGRTQMTVWDVKSVIFEEGKTAHPTQKPVDLYTRSLENHTNAGEYVYDPFGGSGTAIIACEKLGRRSLNMELDPKYCDVIVKRWEEYTGKKAILEERHDAASAA